VSRATTGFIYYVSVTGITGARRHLPPELIRNVQRVRRRVRWPVCVGFGVSTPEQARRLARVADGVIVGSAIVQQMERAPGGSIVRVVGRLARRLAAATHGANRRDG
jgi:tryptophan synthase alpha chain